MSRWSWMVFGSVLLASCDRGPKPPSSSAPLAATSAGSIPSSSALSAPVASTPVAPGASSEPLVAGVLSVRAAGDESPSHGMGSEPWTAHFLVRNETSSPLTVTVTDLVLRSDEPSLPDAERRHPERIERLRVNGVALSVTNEPATFGAPPHEEVDLRIDAHRDDVDVRYHVVYFHEARFSVAAGGDVRRGSTMSFRHPHRANEGP